MGGKGGSGGTTYQLFSKATTYSFNLWRSQLFTIGSPFRVNVVAVKFSFASVIAANMTITPVLGFDDGSNIVSGTVINSTNYPNSEDAIIMTADNFGFNVHGINNFYLEFRFSGSALATIVLPIDIEVEKENVL